jgi:hypothetical protein
MQCDPSTNRWSTPITIGQGTQPQVAITATGGMAIAYIGQFRPRLRLWDGIAWSELDGSVTSADGIGAYETATNPDIDVAGDAPVVAWETPVGAKVRQFVPGQGWRGYPNTTFGPTPIDGSGAVQPALALHAAASPPALYVAYQMNGFVRVRRWDPSAASFVGIDGSDFGLASGSAANIAIGRSPRDPIRDAVCVSWVATSGGVSQVLVRCHDL